MTTSPTAIASAPPEPPSPVMTVTIGVRSRVISAIERAIASAMPRSSDSAPGMGARDVDEGDDRQPEPLGELHHPHRLAVALRVGHPEVAPDVLLGVGALLLADDDDPPAVEPGEAGDDRGVVAEQPVAVELDEVVGHRRDELERARPVQVAGQLDPRPDGVARVAGGLASGASSGRGPRRTRRARRPARPASSGTRTAGSRARSPSIGPVPCAAASPADRAAAGAAGPARRAAPAGPRSGR